MIKSLLGGGLLRLLQVLDPSPEKLLAFDASGSPFFIDYLVNKSANLGVTAATPGDLSVAAGTMVCRYDKVGDYVDVSIQLTFTPTYTTASGNLIVTGLPFAADADTAVNLIPMTTSTAFVWPNTATVISLSPQAGTTQAIVLGQKSGASGQGLSITALTSGTAYTLRFRGRYRTTRV